LMMDGGLSTLFCHQRTDRCFFKHIVHFSSTYPPPAPEKG